MSNKQALLYHSTTCGVCDQPVILVMTVGAHSLMNIDDKLNKSPHVCDRGAVERWLAWDRGHVLAFRALADTLDYFEPQAEAPGGDWPV